ncbi:MAG: hypothetical protein ACKV0T_30055 [Planctomycetales bacterium]
MAKKKPAPPASKGRPKPPPKAKAKQSSASRSAAAKSPSSKPAPAQRAATKKAPAAPNSPTLGRPKVTGEELLYMLFKEDYHARQVFEFLRVNTVKELEQYSAQEIFKRLSQPVRNTVDRIRQTLAVYNRCLADDIDYALERKAEREES